MQLALPDCVMARSEERSRNGFSCTQAAAQNHLLLFEAQGLLRADGGNRRRCTSSGRCMGQLVTFRCSWRARVEEA